MSTPSINPEVDDGRRPLEVRDGDVVIATATPFASVEELPDSWQVTASGHPFVVRSERQAAAALATLYAVHKAVMA